MTGGNMVLTNQTFAFNTNYWLTIDQYDNEGNTTNSAGTPFQYDALDHVTNAVVNGLSILMIYNGDGNRVKKSVGATTTYYLIDDRNPSGYAQAVEEWTDSGAGASLSRVYNYGMDLISQNTGGTTYYLEHDGHGSTRMLLTTGGAVQETYAYDAFATPIAGPTTPLTAYLYCGQQRDFNLGQDYNRARYLNPNTGRFWTMDTYAGNNEAPLSLHKYLYAADDPVDNEDPSGNDFETMAVMDIMSGFFAQIAPMTVAAPSTTGVTPTSRPLTQGEISMAQTIFGGKITYSKVHVVHQKWIFTQAYDRPMTPSGDIYVSDKTGSLGSAYSSDYSKTTTLGQPLVYSQAGFIHEMTHAWQHQVGISVKWEWAGEFAENYLNEPNYDYDFATLGTRDFKGYYGIEEQAQIVQDFYLLLHGAKIYRNGAPLQHPPPLQSYQIVTGKYFP